MEIRNLRSFVTLAEQLHFGKAARLLHLSQPALSKQIRALEEELGGALFERSRHGSALTAAGRGFLVEARSLIAHADRVLASGQHAVTGSAGTLAVGFGVAVFELVPKLIAKLREQRPGVQITLRDLSTAAQIEALRSGSLDVGFLRLPAGDGFEAIPVHQERSVLVAPASYPARTLERCAGDPFVSIKPDVAPGFYAHTVRLCEHHGVHPRVVQEAREFATVLALVAAGTGVAIVPESTARTPMAGVRVQRLAGADATWQVGAAWRAKRNEPVLNAFIALVKAET
jgi:DNA-binding transcriptional LysR family regulator